MDNRKVFGLPGTKTVVKNPKENLVTAKEIVSGQPGTRTETKNFKLAIQMEN